MITLESSFTHDTAARIEHRIASHRKTNSPTACSRNLCTVLHYLTLQLTSPHSVGLRDMWIEINLDMLVKSFSSYQINFSLLITGR